MKKILPLLVLAAIAGCGEKTLVQRNEIEIHRDCIINSFNPKGTSRKDIDSITTLAFETTGDETIDEAFVIPGYANPSLGNLLDNKIARATTHYTTTATPSHRGIPDTRAMPERYQNELTNVCYGSK